MAKRSKTTKQYQESTQNTGGESEKKVVGEVL